jgi:phosphoribosylanthranilate isomerase
VGKFLTQIYEIQTPDEAETLIEVGVDHIGSVLTAPDRRKKESLGDTISLVSALGRKSSLIPLFRDTEMISHALDQYRPDIVHFCEILVGNGGNSEINVSFERQRLIRERFPEINIMRSVPIAQPGMAEKAPTLEIAHLFEPISDFFLTDTLVVNGAESLEHEQPVDGFIGITGKTCDWGMASALVSASKIPVILAGGISPENVSDGLDCVNPAGVDSCTLTNARDKEGNPVRFRKDIEKVKLLVEKVRQKEKII